MFPRWKKCLGLFSVGLLFLSACDEDSQTEWLIEPPSYVNAQDPKAPPQTLISLDNKDNDEAVPLNYGDYLQFNDLPQNLFFNIVTTCTYAERSWTQSFMKQYISQRFYPYNFIPEAILIVSKIVDVRKVEDQTPEVEEPLPSEQDSNDEASERTFTERLLTPQSQIAQRQRASQTNYTTEAIKDPQMIQAYQSADYECVFTITAVDPFFQTQTLSSPVFKINTAEPYELDLNAEARSLNLKDSEQAWAYLPEDDGQIELIHPKLICDDQVFFDLSTFIKPQSELNIQNTILNWLEYRNLSTEQTHLRNCRMTALKTSVTVTAAATSTDLEKVWSPYFDIDLSGIETQDPDLGSGLEDASEIETPIETETPQP